jgi:hypothetical protein
MKAGPNTINRLLVQTQKIVDTWTANQSFLVGGLTLQQLVDAQTRAARLSEAVEAKRVEMVGLANERDRAAQELMDIASRVRSGIRAFYGPDSTQYEQAGGVRRSERKSRSSGKAVASSMTKAE